MSGEENRSIHAETLEHVPSRSSSCWIHTFNERHQYICQSRGIRNTYHWSVHREWPLSSWRSRQFQRSVSVSFLRERKTSSVIPSLSIWTHPLTKNWIRYPIYHSVSGQWPSSWFRCRCRSMDVLSAALRNFVGRRFSGQVSLPWRTASNALERSVDRRECYTVDIDREYCELYPSM